MTDTPLTEMLRRSAVVMDENIKTQLAAAIARDIFECGDHGSQNTTRLQFKHQAPCSEHEISMGGMNESSLAQVIGQSILRIFCKKTE